MITVFLPLITTPVASGVLELAAMAGHPQTKFAGALVRNAGRIERLTPATFVHWLAGVGQQPIMAPGGALLRALHVEVPGLLWAEDVCRIVGRQDWSDQPYACIQRMITPRTVTGLTPALTALEVLAQQAADLITPQEIEAYRVHQAINSRGLHIEPEVVTWLHAIIEQRERARRAALGKAGHLASMTATEALKPGGILDRLLKAQNLTLKNRSEDALIELLASGACKPPLDLLLQTLIGHGRIAKSKVDGVRAGVSKDGRLREQFAIWAARTWRFSSRGVQVQNLPKPIDDIDYAALVRAMANTDLGGLALLSPTGSVDDIFPAYVRMMFSAAPEHDLIVLDWNAIEPRIRAWLSDDQEHLDAWRQGRDLYCELISSIVGRTVTKASDPHLRTVGKVADIGCGYNMGNDSFSDLCTAHDVNLDKLGMSAERVVQKYRTKYWLLSDPRRGLWARLHAGAILAVKTGCAVVGRIGFERTADGHLDMTLPNGSRRRWWKADVQMRPPKWAKDGDRSQDRPVVVVASTPDGVVDQVMYGGRILENACQAIGREILVELLIELDRRGIPVVAHCHDEVVLEVAMTAAPMVLELVQGLAATSPGWAEGLPLRVEAFISPIWTKESPL